MFEIKFQNIKKEAFLNNLNTVINDSNCNVLPLYLENKIKTECERNGFLFNDILNKIRTDRMYAAFFIKDPIKQNIAEKLQFEILLQKFHSLKKLPVYGKNALYINDNGFIVSEKTPIVKSIDFRDNDSYFYCKYINENGGSQDNQFNDCKFFINAVNKNTYINKKFYLIINGNYFTENKIRELNILQTVYNLIICNSELIKI